MSNYKTMIAAVGFSAIAAIGLTGCTNSELDELTARGFISPAYVDGNKSIGEKYSVGLGEDSHCRVEVVHSPEGGWWVIPSGGDPVQAVSVEAILKLPAYADC